ncbi:MAG: hypothetical protein ABI216_05660, partial [Devosia sp.]
APGSTQLPGQLAIARSYANQSKALERRESFKFNQEQNTTLALLASAGNALHHNDEFWAASLPSARLINSTAMRALECAVLLHHTLPTHGKWAFPWSGFAGYYAHTHHPLPISPEILTSER